MATCRELYEKYSTGTRYISPAAIEYPDSNMRSSYRCKTHFGTILREYLDHLYWPPTNRCRQIPVSYDSIIRAPDGADLTEKEIEWASIEYRLREAINNFFGIGNFVEFVITIKEN